MAPAFTEEGLTPSGLLQGGQEGSSDEARAGKDGRGTAAMESDHGRPILNPGESCLEPPSPTPGVV